MGSGRSKKDRRKQKEDAKRVWSMPPTIVVTGHPRAGTTALMRMLYHGGIELIVDNVDQPKEFWPYGDAEVRDVRGWVRENTDPTLTSGKAIKIVAPYIDAMFLDRPCKVLFILRDLNEVITSLLAIQTIWNVPPDEAVASARSYLKHLGVPVHYIHYRDMVKYPKSTATMIADFLERDMDIDGMVKAVDPNARTKMTTEKSKRILTFHFEQAIVDDDTDNPIELEQKEYS